MSTLAVSGALFGRTDVARLLNIPQWLLGNFADRRYPYGLAPSVSGGKGRGKKSLYTLADVYKVAIAYRMFIANQDTRVIGEALRALFPKSQDPMVIAVKERAAQEANARCVVIDSFQFSRGIFITELPDDGCSVVFPEWQGKKPSAKRSWIALRPRRVIAEEFRLGNLRTAFVMPFDELLNWVDSQILGREVTFARSTETKKR
jgi:hypothetical protein